MISVLAVLFDYGLVLSEAPDPASWLALQQVFGVSELLFSSAYWRYRHDYDRGTLNGRSYWMAVAADFDQELSAHQLATLIAEDVRLWTKPNTAMIEWAARLQRAGIKTGILSNIGDAMEEGIVAHAGWLAGFAHHTYSHRLGLAKPELAIYRHAAAGLGIETENILFIDDREENVAAAKESGMQAVRYKNHQGFLSDMRSLGLEHLLDV